jgi:hypothetical protein
MCDSSVALTVYLASTWAHAPSDPVTVLYFWARSHRREKRRLALSSQHVSARLPLNGYLRNFMLGNFGQFTRRPKYILLLPTTSNRHKSALFEWNSISLLGQPRRYKYYANVPQCCVTCTLPICCLERSLNCMQSSQSSALKLPEDTEISSRA